MISQQNKDVEIQSLFSQENTSDTMSFFHRYNRLMSYYRCAIMEIETKFNVLKEEFSLRFDRNPINSIKTRLKKPIS